MVTLLERLDARSWLRQRLMPLHLLVLDRLEPSLRAERFALDLIQTFYLLGRGRWPTEPLAAGAVLEQLRAVRAGDDADPAEYLEDLALDALTWTPGRKADPSSQFIHDLSRYGLREALALLVEELPELSSMTAFTEHVEEGYVRIAGAARAQSQAIHATLEALVALRQPSDRVATLAVVERRRRGARAPQTRGVLLPPWRRGGGGGQA